MSRIPEAADLKAEADGRGLRFLVNRLATALVERAAQGEYSLAFTAEFNQNFIDVMVQKGYTISHDGTDYQISW